MIELTGESLPRITGAQFAKVAPAKESSDLKVQVQTEDGPRVLQISKAAVPVLMAILERNLPTHGGRSTPKTS